MTTHICAQYRGESGRQRWAVLAMPANVWYFPTRYGYRAALALAWRMNKAKL